MADKLITIRLPEDTIRLDYTTKSGASGYDGMEPVTVSMIVRVEDACDEEYKQPRREDD